MPPPPALPAPLPLPLPLPSAAPPQAPAAAPPPPPSARAMPPLSYGEAQAKMLEAYDYDVVTQSGNMAMLASAILDIEEANCPEPAKSPMLKRPAGGDKGVLRTQVCEALGHIHPRIVFLIISDWVGYDWAFGLEDFIWRYNPDADKDEQASELPSIYWVVMVARHEQHMRYPDRFQPIPARKLGKIGAFLEKVAAYGLGDQQQHCLDAYKLLEEGWEAWDDETRRSSSQPRSATPESDAGGSDDSDDSNWMSTPSVPVTSTTRQSRSGNNPQPAIVQQNAVQQSSTAQPVTVPFPVGVTGWSHVAEMADAIKRHLTTSPNMPMHFSYVGWSFGNMPGRLAAHSSASYPNSAFTWKVIRAALLALGADRYEPWQFVLMHPWSSMHARVGECVCSVLTRSYSSFGGANAAQAGRQMSLTKRTEGEWRDKITIMGLTGYARERKHWLHQHLDSWRPRIAAQEALMAQVRETEELERKLLEIREEARDHLARAKALVPKMKEAVAESHRLDLAFLKIYRDELAVPDELMDDLDAFLNWAVSL